MSKKVVDTKDRKVWIQKVICNNGDVYEYPVDMMRGPDFDGGRQVLTIPVKEGVQKFIPMASITRIEIEEYAGELVTTIDTTAPKEDKPFDREPY